MPPPGPRYLVLTIAGLLLLFGFVAARPLNRKCDSSATELKLAARVQELEAELGRRPNRPPATP